jgi:hypothetical protein
MRPQRLILLAVTAVIGCAPFPAQPVDQLEAELGGPGAVLDLFTTGTEADIRGTLARHGIAFQVHALGTEAVDGCPQFFPVADRDTWHDIGGEFYFVDESGRPSRAYTFLPPVIAEGRSTSCQAKVGQWGDAEDPGNDFDGGHLLGSQLGGWGKRANLVPQDANLNRGTWATLENQIAKCGSLPAEALRYFVGAQYLGDTALVPHALTVELTGPSEGVFLSFDNVDAGGPGGPAEKNRGVDFLRRQGCQ